MLTPGQRQKRAGRQRQAIAGSSASRSTGDELCGTSTVDSTDRRPAVTGACHIHPAGARSALSVEIRLAVMTPEPSWTTVNGSLEMKSPSEIGKASGTVRV